MVLMTFVVGEVKSYSAVIHIYGLRQLNIPTNQCVMGDSDVWSRHVSDV